MGDISFRAKDILSIVDYIICENPIHSLKLLNKLNIKKRLFSLHDYNEEFLIKKIEKYQHNSSIALISDAGSPLISDPGYNLVLDYIKKNIKITTIPGPSSIISALQLSGLPISNFTFFGFVPKNTGGLKVLLENISNNASASVVFISGLRLVGFLQVLLKEKINRDISVSKEITKKNEKTFRGTSEIIIEKLTLNPLNKKGEFVLVISGINKKNIRKVDLGIELQIKKLLIKFSLTETVQIVHKLTNVSKKEIYKMALALKND